MTLLVLLCTSKLHLLNSELIVFFLPAGSFVCVSNCEEKQASACPPLTQAQNGGAAWSNY